ncbi:hypothetical protein [Nocardioides limicola]|nr:hypothetical protein [Nocardioides sp. DJM-14]
MAGKRYEAEVTDPTTGEATTFSARTEVELERLIEEHLGMTFPEVI